MIKTINNAGKDSSKPKYYVKKEIDNVGKEFLVRFLVKLLTYSVGERNYLIYLVKSQILNAGET